MAAKISAGSLEASSERLIPVDQRAIMTPT